MSGEYYKVHRPKTLKGVVGQEQAVATLQRLLRDIKRFPHALLFTGPSGCGKTTLARIMAGKLECHPKDFREVNCADVRGIDGVRDIRKMMGLAAMNGKTRVWLIDEAHRLTGEAQDALLKMLEDTPRHVYFMLATTEPNKLRTTIRTRSTEVAVKPMKREFLVALLKRVAEKEEIELTDEVIEAIVDEEHSQGSARKALVTLNSISGMGPEEALQHIASHEHKEVAIQLARLLIRPGVTWTEVAKVLKGIEDDAEGLRRMVLGYASSVLLNGGKLAPRCVALLETFQDNLFDSGKPGLVLRCWQAVEMGRSSQRR